MKHEYKVGGDAWYEGMKFTIEHIGENIDDGYIDYAIIFNDQYRDYKPLHDLSPYPPVKAVDGWAVVNSNGNIISVELTSPEINWVAASGYRIVKGRFIPDNS